MRGTAIDPQPSPVSAAPIRIDDFLKDGTAVMEHEQVPGTSGSLANPPPVQPAKLDRNARSGAGRDPRWTYFFCRRLIADPRFANLVASHRHILLVGALEFADVNGV